MMVTPSSPAAHTRTTPARAIGPPTGRRWACSTSNGPTMGQPARHKPQQRPDDGAAALRCAGQTRDSRSSRLPHRAGCSLYLTIRMRTSVAGRRAYAGFMDVYADAAGLVERSAEAYAAGVPDHPADDGFFGPASVTWRSGGDLSGWWPACA